MKKGSLRWCAHVVCKDDAERVRQWGLMEQDGGSSEEDLVDCHRGYEKSGPTGEQMEKEN